jgi:hypothetical protein
MFKIQIQLCFAEVHPSDRLNPEDGGTRSCRSTRCHRLYYKAVSRGSKPVQRSYFLSSRLCLLVIRCQLLFNLSCVSKLLPRRWNASFPSLHPSSIAVTLCNTNKLCILLTERKLGLYDPFSPSFLSNELYAAISAVVPLLYLSNCHKILANKDSINWVVFCNGKKLTFSLR